MINILVIEYFGERIERKQFWEKLSQLYLESRSVKISICPQNKTSGYLHNSDGTPFSLDPYDLIFVHESDKSYNVTDNYIDLAGDKSIVCYSGGAVSVEVPKLNKFQIKSLPISLLKKNAAKFFDTLANESALSLELFYGLAGIDPKREASFNLLQMFLPLDIELQLGDLDKCRKQAELLIKKEDDERAATTLLHQIYATNSIQLPQGTDSNSEVSVKLKDRLMLLAKMVATDKAPSLEIVFGYQLDENGNINKQEGSKLREEGFHKTFESLRDSLLNGQA